MKILTIVGARPQFIKAAVVNRIAKNYGVEEVLIHTGQHYDKNLSDIFFKELNIEAPKYNLGIGSYSHAVQTAKMLRKLESILKDENPDAVLIYGDTNSTLAGVLCATKMHVPTIHVEACLRSHNRKMPEEINRIATDHIADLLFCPTQNAMQIAKKEGLDSKAVFSGDVMFDSILYYKEKANEAILTSLDLPKKYYLATIHRAENTDDENRLKNIFSAFSKLDYPVVLPLHPRTKKYLAKYRFEPKNVYFIEPVGYKMMIALMQKAEKILTDSGGLQKEAFFLEKQCLTMRDETEWVETLVENRNIIVGAEENKILNAINLEKTTKALPSFFGNGDAGKKILEKIKSTFS